MSKKIHINNITIEANGLSLNSHQVKEGDTFLACKSFADVNSHGIAYAGDAIKRGAAAILWEPTEQLNNMPNYCVQPIEVDGQIKQLSVPLYRINNLSQHISQIGAEFYSNPSKELNVIGITGTNGKTSVSYFIAQALSQQNFSQQHISQQNIKHQCAVIGTLGNGLYQPEEIDSIQETQQTTPDPLKVQSLLHDFKQQKATDVVMEVSSHALDQGRVKAIDFNIAVFTNLSRDHLDYHGDMESYKAAKKSLFDFESLEAIIVNVDDEVGQELIQHSLNTKGLNSNLNIISYSTKAENTIHGHSHLLATDIQYSDKGFSFSLNDKTFNIPLIGHFNISNVLASIGVLTAMNYSLDDAIKSLETLTPVAGRMQMINPEQTDKTSVIIDFAHTPDALEKALQGLKTHCNGRLWCVFGCGGDRDKGKRSLMGQIAEQYADQVILTSDNPRTEDPTAIIKDIEQGMKGNYQVEVDRKAAIKTAIKQAENNDIILIAGKGHEDYQEIMGVKLPYSDIEYSQELLAA